MTRIAHSRFRRSSRRARRTGALAAALAAMIMATLIGSLAAKAGPVRTAANSGSVCFERGARPGGPEIRGTFVSFRPHLGCLSSSCTEVIAQTFAIDAGDGEIALTSRFSVRRREVAFCTSFSCTRRVIDLASLIASLVESSREDCEL